MDEDNEILDVVDTEDRVVGTIKRGESKRLFASGEGYLRYACCFLQNSEGKIWIPKRTANKKIAPNGLDFSASEHVQSGETYLHAVVRGLDEELGMRIAEPEIRFIGKVLPNGERRSFSSIYVLEQEDVPDFNRDDFVSYEWLSVPELRGRLASGVEAKYDLASAVELLGD